VQSAADKTRQAANSNFLVITDIDDFSNHTIGFRYANQCLHSIENVTEAPALGAISKHGDRLVQKRLTDEVWQDHAIAPSLSRSNGIEQSDNSDWNMLFIKIGEAQKLIESLRAGIAPPRLVRRADQQVIFFPKRLLLALAIHLGGRDIHEASVHGRRDLEQPPRACRIGSQRLQLVAVVVHRACR